MTPDDDAIDLTDTEAEVVARRLIADLITDAVQHGLICHGDVPRLSERSWHAVADQLAQQAQRHAVYAASHARGQNIDIDALMEKIQ